MQIASGRIGDITKNVVNYLKHKLFFMKHLVIVLSFVFVSLGLFVTKERTHLPTSNGCKLITCTKVPVVEKSSNDAATEADDYQPLSPINRFIILQ